MLKAWRRSAGPAFAAAAAAINEDDGDAIYFFVSRVQLTLLLVPQNQMYVRVFFLYDDAKIQIDFSLIKEMKKYELQTLVYVLFLEIFWTLNF